VVALVRVLVVIAAGDREAWCWGKVGLLLLWLGERKVVRRWPALEAVGGHGWNERKRKKKRALLGQSSSILNGLEWTPPSQETTPLCGRANFGPLRNYEGQSIFLTQLLQNLF